MNQGLNELITYVCVWAIIDCEERSFRTSVCALMLFPWYDGLSGFQKINSMVQTQRETEGFHSELQYIQFERSIDTSSLSSNYLECMGNVFASFSNGII